MAILGGVDSVEAMDFASASSLLARAGHPVHAAATPGRGLRASETVTVVSTLPATTVVGQIYDVRVEVTAASGTPSGHVLVGDGAGATCRIDTLAEGIGSCSLAAAEAGGYVVTATYAPDTDAFSASSATAFQAVNRAGTTLVVVGHAPRRSVPGQPVTVAASLAAASPGAGRPTGPVDVGDGDDACTIADGDSSCSLVLHARGPRRLTATYGGDANYADSSATVEHLVNRLPVPVPAAFATYEAVDLAIGPTEGLLAGAGDPDADVLTIAGPGTFAASGIGGTVTLAADGAFRYVPPPGTYGVATFAYRIGDGYESVEAVASVTVAPVNRAPSFALAADPRWPTGAGGPRRHAGFAQVVSFGAPAEAGQRVLAWHLRTIGDADGVVSAAAVAPDGTLSYVLTGRTGVAAFGVRLQDDGGTAGGGSDTSTEQSFAIRVDRGLDLSVSIVEAPFFVAGGGVFESTFVVRNAGPDAAAGARVRNRLPFNLVDARWTCAAGAGGHCTASGAGDVDELVAVPAGGTLTWHLVAGVSAEPETEVRQTVSVSAPADRPDIDGSNDLAGSSTPVGLFIDGFDRGAGRGSP